VRDERRERGGLEVAFPDLDEIDAGLGGAARLVHRGGAPAIGHEAHHHAAPLPSRSVTSRRSRAANITARSANPAARFTRPSPLTAPRTKLFVRNGRSGGHASTK